VYAKIPLPQERIELIWLFSFWLTFHSSLKTICHPLFLKQYHYRDKTFRYSRIADEVTGNFTPTECIDCFTEEVKSKNSQTTSPHESCPLDIVQDIQDWVRPHTIELINPSDPTRD